MNAVFETYRPDGFATMNAYLFAEKPEELIGFLKDAFYAEELNRSIHSETGALANVILRIGTSCFMISQATGPYTQTNSAFYLYVDDVDAMHTRALKMGAREDFSPADMAYGDRQSGVIDPAGNYWWISKRLVEKPYSS